MVRSLPPSIIQLLIHLPQQYSINHLLESTPLPMRSSSVQDMTWRTASVCSYHQTHTCLFLMLSCVLYVAFLRGSFVFPSGERNHKCNTKYGHEF